MAANEIAETVTSKSKVKIERIFIDVGSQVFHIVT